LGTKWSSEDSPSQGGDQEDRRKLHRLQLESDRDDFTSGTTEPPPPNEPISGSAGTPELNEAGTLLTLSGGSLVNNSYGAPEADGCGGIFQSAEAAAVIASE
jgi:hypothetical protein